MSQRRVNHEHDQDCAGGVSPREVLGIGEVSGRQGLGTGEVSSWLGLGASGGGAGRVSRRQVLGAAATVGVAGLVLSQQGSALLATKPDGEETGSAEATREATRALPALALLDGSLQDDELASAREMLSPLEPTVLGPDLLWQWRGGLGQQLGEGATAVAITRWDKAMVLSGLAREARLPIRQERIGHSVFRTEIG